MDKDAYTPRNWAPGERPSLPGSPSTPEHTTPKRVAYFVVGLIVALTGGLGNGLVTANILNLQGSLGAYAAEMQWLPAAYVMTIVSMNLLLVKFRQQFGLRLFTEIFLVLYALVTFAHLYANSLSSAIAVRAAHGMVGGALGVLGLYYTLQAFPARHRLKGVVLGLGFAQLALPLARVFTSELLQIGEWHGLYLFELGLTLVALGCVLALKLPPGDRVQSFEPLDFLTFILFAPGVALLCAVLAQGRTAWWLEARWVGICLACSIVLIVAALAIEHNRARPLLNTRWLTTGKIAKLFLSVLLFRIVLSESTGAVGFLQALNLNTDQMQNLFIVVLCGSVAGLLLSAITINPATLNRSLMFALALIAIGALIDAHATSQTRPANMYISQFLLAFGGTYFIGPTMVAGMGAVIAEPRNLVSFSVMFTMTQNMGGLVGTAIVGTIQTAREKYHSSYLVEHLTMLDPQVATRVQSGAAAYGSVLADPALRSAQGVARLGAAATREANVLAYNDVFLMIAGVAIATLLWLLVSQFWTSITIGARRLVGPVHDAQSAMAIVPITNSEPSNDRR
ncbi:MULTISPECIES: MFS transporter [unclassified Janthinobacterium]|uniref:MFS transporter n=1 Tax=unclassified Janthinobacterium TaxID=2610881 RepID=UPI0016118D5D|nr:MULTISPECIES: MFS transporter [unclassified Janthinobacterium]MBB5367699.1 MFS family permease [Janthinobacterium sp. K2C7]MBB5379823.1 MFS family permease [Janthinobacterium sp. K2Li3]MBB5386081.1 MFS family permease [Janthinobacterium sp. K2E3]